MDGGEDDDASAPAGVGSGKIEPAQPLAAAARSELRRRTWPSRPPIHEPPCSVDGGDGVDEAASCAARLGALEPCTEASKDDVDETAASESAEAPDMLLRDACRSLSHVCTTASARSPTSSSGSKFPELGSVCSSDNPSEDRRRRCGDASVDGLLALLALAPGSGATLGFADAGLGAASNFKPSDIMPGPFLPFRGGVAFGTKAGGSSCRKRPVRPTGESARTRGGLTVWSSIVGSMAAPRPFTPHPQKALCGALLANSG